MKKHFITYGNEKFKLSRERICKEAADTGWFDTSNFYTPDDLDQEFKDEFEDILEQPRGGGYWIWKPHIILKKLEEIDEGDVLVYLDAGCSIYKKGEDKFNEYIDTLIKSDVGVLSFQLDKRGIETRWTTKEIFKYFDIEPNSEIVRSNQFVGGIRVMKKCDNLYKLLNMELDAYRHDHNLVTDFYNKNEQSHCFKDNRHEQSIFSIIRKKNNPVIFPFLQNDISPWKATRIRR